MPFPLRAAEVNRLLIPSWAERKREFGGVVAQSEWLVA